MPARKLRFLFVGELTMGNETFVLNLREAVGRRSDISSTWLPIEFKPKEFLARIPPVSVNWSLRAALVARARVHQLEKRGARFDAAFFHNQIPALFLTEFRRRVPTVISLDATPLLFDRFGQQYHHHVAARSTPVERIKHRITRGAYADAKFLLPWSEWAKQSLLVDYDLAAEKISVTPPGINLTDWDRGSPQKRTDDRPRVLFVGGDLSRKGGDMLMKVARRPRFQDCEFHFVTKSPITSDAENVFIHREAGPNSPALKQLFRNASVFVLPSRADIYPISICEAMAMSLPIITTGVGAIGEMVREGETGLIVPRDDEEALFRSLRKVLDDPELRRRLGANSRRYAELNFDLMRSTQKILHCLEEAAAGRS